jgi:hypothetical protein
MTSLSIEMFRGSGIGGSATTFYLYYFVVATNTPDQLAGQSAEILSNINS